MASESVICVRNVSKIYPAQSSRVMLRQEAMGLLRRTFRNIVSEGALSVRDAPARVRGFQALKNINFDVNAGEGIALVGRNGSGKTTMIRLLANIMRPTMGTIEVHGRYAALIGLGSGFINDMTGRENVYLNAAIYGVPPRETDEIIDEIIEFADIGQFIDRRINEYSSGMKARLGFSVASHILPDIVMVDEALAVGDAAFREKCHEKISALLAENRTLVLVSHNAADVRRLCQRAIWLHDGKIQMQGSTKDVLKEYESFMKVKVSPEV